MNRRSSTFSCTLLLLACFLLLIPGSGAAAQEGESDDIDSLFEDPDSGVVDDEESGQAGEEDDGEEDKEDKEDGEEPLSEGVDLGALTTAPTTFRGRVNSSAGAALGFEEWPESDAAEGRDAEELLRGSGVYDMSATFSVDARPEPFLRFYGSLSTELNEDAMSFTTPSMNELFVDYTFADRYFFRAGKQNLKWGQARLLGNPANLVDRVSDGVAVRGTAPIPGGLGGGSLNGVIYSKRSWVEDYRSGHPGAFAYAALYENTFGPLSFELSSHYKEKELVGSAASVSFGLGRFDLTLEGLGRWNSEDPGDGIEEQGALAQLLYENSDRSWTFLAEYEYDSAVADNQGHYAGIGVQAPRFGGGGWRPQLRWKHAFEDDSGEVVPAISGTVAPRLTASIGVPVVYGAPGSHYREAQGDTEDDEDAIPVDDVVSVLLGVSLSFSF
ncbi:MAG: hypothetical protein ACLFPW_12010 [Spirochaetaceae bacterium]